MPVFSRTKLLLHDDCFDQGTPDLTLNYSGPNPQKAYAKVKEMFTTVFALKGNERIQEIDYSWNRDGDKETFNVKWQLVKDMDHFSYLVFNIKLKGQATHGKKGPEGKATITIDGAIRTEYPQDTVWERSIFYEIGRVFWHKVFYHEKRADYQNECRDIMSLFINELKSFFNLLPERI